jgi:hypothetical protein
MYVMFSEMCEQGAMYIMFSEMCEHSQTLWL